MEGRLDSESIVILGVPALDFITLTTKEMWLYSMGECVIRRESIPRGGRIQGYTSVLTSDDGRVTVGYGAVNGSILRLAGPAAHLWAGRGLLESCTSLNTNLSRIDVQYTSSSPCPVGTVAAIHRALETDYPRNHQGRRLHMSFFQTTDRKGHALSTLYVGSRKSPFLVRIYEKKINDSELPYLRIEAEVKKPKSQLLHEGDILYRQDLRAFVLNYALSLLPESVQESLPWQGDDQVPDWRLDKASSSIRRRMNWLESTVRPALRKLVDDGLAVGDLDYDELRGIIEGVLVNLERGRQQRGDETTDY